jgi:hypothetical protein
MEIEDYDKVLQTYTLEEILEHNDMTPGEFLYALEYSDFGLIIPQPKPLDIL